jgi:putative ABC transport system ATP-binding protein
MPEAEVAGKEPAKDDKPYRSPKAPEGGDPLIKLRGIGKTYTRGGESLRILENLDLDVPKASFEALMGPSGSGKSTLLNLIAGLDRPTAGTIDIAGKRLDQMSESALARWRADTVGFIFQSYNLLPVLTAVENVELPLLLTKVASSERRKRAETALRVVGLEDRSAHYPRQLSGGQEQRVAIARAIVNDPALIVADEPTGDLDRKSADEILELLEKLNTQLGKTIVMVTHDPHSAAAASRVIHLDKGKFVEADALAPVG